jgi:hypothetical protein
MNAMAKKRRRDQTNAERTQIGMAKSSMKHRKPGRGTNKKAAAKKSQKRTSARTPSPNHKRKTKADQILALVKQPGGATLKAIMSATSWKAHSVRGFISGYVVKRMKLTVKSFRRDGERAYAIKT